jgi:TolB-like protein
MRFNSAVCSIALALAISLQFFVAQSRAGQVVTDDLRQRVLQSIHNEGSQPFHPAANTLAVLYFHNKTARPDLDPLEKGMAVMLITDLAKVKEIRVIERAQIQALVEELQLGTSGLVAPDTAPRVGQLLGARFVISGDLGDMPPEQITIAAHLLEMPEISLLGTPTRSGYLDDLLRMEKGLVFEIIRLLEIELTPEQTEELRKPITLDLKALMLFFQGIQSSDRGAYEEAAAYYRDALQRDPGLGPAHAAVLELERLRLIVPHPGSDALLRTLHKRVSVNTGPVQGPITRREFSEPVSIQGPGAAANVEIQWR